MRTGLAELFRALFRPGSLELKNGEVFTARVLRRKGDFALLRVGGEELKAELKAEVEPGSLIRVVVEGSTGGRPLLRIVGEEAGEVPPPGPEEMAQKLLRHSGVGRDDEELRRALVSYFRGQARVDRVLEESGLEGLLFNPRTDQGGSTHHFLRLIRLFAVLFSASPSRSSSAEEGKGLKPDRPGLRELLTLERAAGCLAGERAGTDDVRHLYLQLPVPLFHHPVELLITRRRSSQADRVHDLEAAVEIRVVAKKLGPLAVRLRVRGDALHCTLIARYEEAVSNLNRGDLIRRLEGLQFERVEVGFRTDPELGEMLLSAVRRPSRHIDLQI